MRGRKVVGIILCVTCLTVGCGGEVYEGKQTDTSSEVVSEAALETEQKEITEVPFLSQYPFSNEKSVYTELENDDEIQICQWNEKEELFYEPEGFESLLFVDNEWLYYLVWEESDKYDYGMRSVCRAPLVQGENSEKPDFDKVENIFEEKPDAAGKKAIWDWAVVGGKYVVGLRGDGKLLQYDIESKETIVSTIDKKFSQIWESSSEILGQIEDSILLYMEQGRSNSCASGLYCYDVKTRKVTCIEEGVTLSSAEEFAFSLEEKYFVYRISDETPGALWMKKFDVDTGKVSAIFTDMGTQVVDDGIEEVLQIKKEDIVTQSIKMFCWNQRVYLQISVLWEDAGEYQAKNLLYSVGMNEQDTLKYEEDLTNALHKYSQVETAEIQNKKCTIIRGECLKIIDGKCIFALGNKEEGYLLGCYDMEKKTYHECSENGPEAYQYCKGTMWSYNGYDEEMDYASSDLIGMVWDVQENGELYGIEQ